MTPGDKKKALQVYGIGVLTVLLCVGAAVAHAQNKNCSAKGGDWKWFSCTMPRQGTTVK